MKEKFHYTYKQVVNFEKEWFSRIEHEEFLNLDILFEYSVAALTTLYKMGDIFLITSRQYEDKLIKEVDKLKIKLFLHSKLKTMKHIY